MNELKNKIYPKRVLSQFSSLLRGEVGNTAQAARTGKAALTLGAIINRIKETRNQAVRT